VANVRKKKRDVCHHSHHTSRVSDGFGGEKLDEARLRPFAVVLVVLAVFNLGDVVGKSEGVVPQLTHAVDSVLPIADVFLLEGVRESPTADGIGTVLPTPPLVAGICIAGRCPVGVLVAAGGLWATLTDLRERVRATGGRAVGRRLVLAGLAVSIPLGQSYFWGSLNVLGDLSDPTDGLVSFLGPYYHLGLVVPTVAFGAHGLLVGGRRARQFLRGRNSARVRAAGLAILAVAGLVTGGLATAAVAGPLGDNADVTRQYERAYEPIESAEFENALVFVPTPYGDWLNHPFQYLRTDPGYDGEVVYALQERQFAVRDAFPDRSLYRYVYRGEWAPFLNRSVEGRLQEIRVATGEEVSLSIEAEVPESVQSLSVRASTTGNGYALAESPGERITFTVRFLDGQAVIESPEFESPVVLPVAGRERLEVRLFADSGGAGSFSYDLTIPVEYDGTYRVLTPRIEVCRNPRLCDGEAAYIPGQHREGVAIEAGFLR